MSDESDSECTGRGSVDLEVLQNWYREYLRRSFTARAGESEEAASEVMFLGKADACRMRIEFGDAYDGLFRNSISELQKTISFKLYAMNACNKRFVEY